MQNTPADEKTYAIIGAAMEVHRFLNKGFLEVVYQDALEIEFRLRDIPYQREVDLNIAYKGHQLGGTYRADFICYGEIIVELKAVSQLIAAHEAQTLHYLRATGYSLALLLNFGNSSLQTKRLIQSV